MNIKTPGTEKQLWAAGCWIINFHTCTAQMEKLIREESVWERT
jgi:hypothetical protein